MRKHNAFLGDAEREKEKTQAEIRDIQNLIDSINKMQSWLIKKKRY